MDILEHFFSQYPTRSFLKGEIILSEGEEPSAGYIVRSGFVKVYDIDASGTERPVVFDVRNEMFPIGWIFGKISKAVYFYEAFTDLTVCVIDRDEFIAAIKKDPSVMFALYDYYVKRHLDLQLRIEGLEQSRAQSKILYTLKFLCSRFGQAAGGNNIEIHLPLTQQNIADFLGITRETAAIELKKLQNRKIISHHTAYYLVNQELLTEAIDEV